MTKVLVVDDDTDLLQMVSIVLSNNNMQVTPLEKCLEFKDYMESEKPDIVLMDIYLGECDGRDLCANLKNNKSYAGTPVILYSAGNITAESVKKSKADDFLSKPFDISQLISRINNYLPAKKTPEEN